MKMRKANKMIAVGTVGAILATGTAHAGTLLWYRFDGDGATIERFTAVLLEHTAGHLPLWLSPEQVKVLPISEKYADYAKKVCESLKNSDIRASIDDRNETLGKRIREISLLRVPVIVIVGEKEAAAGSVSVRRDGVDKGVVTVQEFIDRFKAAVAEELA